LARLVAPQNEYGVDPFGLELDFTKAAIAPVLWLYRTYFRVETHGIDQVPTGRVMLISNHSGQLPLDATMIAMSLLLEGEPPRVVRAMVEKWAPTLPFVAPFFARIGQVVGTPENCRRMLAAGETIMVFPEGVRGLNKTYDKKYQLQDFGTGFMRLALETQTPIVPVAVVGAEEQAPAFFDFKAAAKLFGIPGRVLAKVLHRSERVIGLDRRPFPGAPKDLEVHQLDIRKRKVEDVFRKGDVKALVHMAIMHDPRLSQAEHHSFNVLGTKAVLQFAAKHGVQKVVVLSSTTVYGPQPEND